MALPSGLPENVSDDEDLARFYRTSGHFRQYGPHTTAFVPNWKNNELSVVRHCGEPLEELRELSTHTVPDAKGAAIISAKAVRGMGLEVTSEEPPPKHANLTAWPGRAGDKDLEKARKKQIASDLAQRARSVFF